jgi:phosphatidylserine/phosphatidylglycerophosphate/cardiolipin synthase-like enzyme
MSGVGVSDWFLSAAERGNDATVIDRRHPGGIAWTDGNALQPLVHGAAYFPELVRCVTAMAAGDLLMFTDWRGDPDERLADTGTEVAQLLVDAAQRGVVVKGLVWRSHLDRLSFSEQENRHLGEQVNAAGGECLRDMRVRPGGSHHQKFVVLRHPGRPEKDVAFVGGIDLCHSRSDDAGHRGDEQKQPMASVYGARPPWHDIQLAVRGPAVSDLELTFRERWDDPAALNRNPIDHVADLLRHDSRPRGVLPPPLPNPAATGANAVQILRTYANRRPRYPFAPVGERSIARAYEKVISCAKSLIYLEDQYFWNSEVTRCFANALRANPDLRLIVVVPHYPDQDGRLSKPPNLVGRQQALDAIRAVGGDRAAIYGLENHAGVPVYVHAKVCVVDDVWTSIGSDNVNRRSWTHDSEVSCAVIDATHDAREPTALDRFGDGARAFARELRLELAREHLDRAAGDEADLIDPLSAFAAFANAARTLQQWTDDNRRGPRPQGRIRPYSARRLTPRTLAWATPVYRTVYDPDGRPASLRRKHRF